MISLTLLLTNKKAVFRHKNRKGLLNLALLYLVCVFYNIFLRLPWQQQKMTETEHPRRFHVPELVYGQQAQQLRGTRQLKDLSSALQPQQNWKLEKLYFQTEAESFRGLLLVSCYYWEENWSILVRFGPHRTPGSCSNCCNKYR